MDLSDVEEKIRKAVLDKARKEAERIVIEARREAEKILEKARREWEENRERVRKQIIENAKRKAEEIIIDAKIKARMKLTEAKREVINEVIKNIEEIVKEGNYDRRGSLRKLLEEAVVPLEGDIRIYVSERDLDLAKDVAGKLNNNVRIVDIKTMSILGGVVAENIDSTIRIDNSYEARLELVRTRLIPVIQRELFGE